jgi:hypothetical protein
VGEPVLLVGVLRRHGVLRGQEAFCAKLASQQATKRRPQQHFHHRSLDEQTQTTAWQK